MSNTVFGKIISGELPASKVYEDEKCLAFLDIQPESKGHLLLIPKESYVWLQDVPDDLLAHLFAKAAMLMRTLKKAMHCDYVQLNVVGRDVPHTHIHLIPRKMDDNIHAHSFMQYEEGEKEAVAEKIRSAI